LGGRQSVAQARTGDAGAWTAGEWATLPNVGGPSPTLSGAPLAQRQSNGLLIRRFRVQIPRGALDSVAYYP
jgi:hypothetical protein